MVLGITLVKILGLILTILSLSCNADENLREEISDSAAIQDYKLSLMPRDNSCVLNYQNFSESGKVDFTLKPPCYFLRRESSEPQRFSYQDAGVKTVIIVVGTPINEETMKAWNLSDDLVCGGEIQGIIIKENGIKLSSKILKGGVWCKDKGADEKDFWFFAHEKD